MVETALVTSSLGSDYLHEQDFIHSLNTRSPKFSISSLLLVVALAALAIGWYAERRRAQRERAAHEDQLGRMMRGSHISGDVDRLVQVSNWYRDRSNDVEFSTLLKAELAFAMWHLWKTESRIDFSWDEPVATSFGSDVLRALGCDSADEYFDVARTAFRDQKQWPEFHDETASDHRSLQDFVVRSLETDYVPSWAR